MPRGVMPRDVQRELRKFVPEPEALAVAGVEALPEFVDMPVYVWNPQTRSSDRATEAVPLVRRDMEPASLHDLMAVLRLVDAGKVGITEKNRWPTPTAIRQVQGVIEGGDYYPDDEDQAAGKRSHET